MKKVIIYCDICNNEIKSVNETAQLTIHTFCESQNPMARITGKNFQDNLYNPQDVCYNCHRYIAECCACAIETRSQSIEARDK